MNEKLLKYLIFAGGLISLLIFLSERSLTIYNMLLIEKQTPEYFEFTEYGELYYFSCIEDFKEALPTPIDKYRLSTRNPSINEADIITFGDSYFDFSRQMTVPERLSFASNKKVHAIYSFYPLSYLNQINYQSETTRLFIYETAERMIPVRFGKGNKMKSMGNAAPSMKVKVDGFFMNLFNGPNEERLDKVLKGSSFSGSIYRQIATFRYYSFGYISQQTPDFNFESEPWLFYGESLNEENTSIRYNHTDEEIELYCDNILELKENLKSEYNLDFVFISVPNKITFMHDKIEPAIVYNKLLPRVHEGLKKRGIPFVDLYSAFKDEDEILYYRTDTHWNELGVDMAVEKILELFSDLEGLKKH